MATHRLKLALSCRKISAVVLRAGTDSIAAMADSMEPEFLPAYKAKLNRVPRCKFFWDPGVAARVGDNLGLRLSWISISSVEVDADEEKSRPLHYRRIVGPFFDSLQGRGIHIEGSRCLSQDTITTAATMTTPREEGS